MTGNADYPTGKAGIFTGNGEYGTGRFGILTWNGGKSGGSGVRRCGKEVKRPGKRSKRPGTGVREREQGEIGNFNPPRRKGGELTAVRAESTTDGHR